MAPAVGASQGGSSAPDTLARSRLGSPAGPLGGTTQLLARSGTAAKNDPAAGVLNPDDIKNVGFFVLFALLGVAFALGCLWFFFWAKNGGFYFKKSDWDDYKSTVLRRKGPNGTLLSGATPSTDLGGGSVYKDVADNDTATQVSGTTGLTGVTAGASEPGERDRRRKKQAQREREKARQKRGEGRRRRVEEGEVQDQDAEEDAKKHLRSYRHEKPARVGGLNKQSEGSSWDGSTEPTSSEMTMSEASARLLPKPGGSSQPAKARGIRKVYSTADKTADRETERIRTEARRLREAGRAAAASGSGRRDFSFQRAAGGGAGSSASESLLSGEEVGTKSYHHPMPELREQRALEKEERRARRGGYQRGRGDEV